MINLSTLFKNALSIFITLILSIILVNNLKSADIYYIDFEAGDDTNNGLSTSYPWKTIPGTRTTSDPNNGWETTDWGTGTINSVNKVQPGTIFRLKPGTTHNSSNGGQIDIDDTYYYTTATESNPILFTAYQAWPGASGTITFDGTGITLNGTGSGLIHARDNINGVQIKGEVTDGITIRDATNEGISLYDQSNILEDWVFDNIKFYNNGTLYSGDNASYGNLVVYACDGLTISNCEVDGNNCATNGFIFGESGDRVINATVDNCIIHDLYGTDDGGIGFKAQNSRIVYTNCISYSNGSKGWDCGEQNAEDTWDIEYKFINCLAYLNNYGLNVSGKNAVRTGTQKAYVINCIIRDNIRCGTWFYSGPYDAHFVHNIYDNNGTANTNYNNCNLRVEPNVSPDDPGTTINIYMYNNCFYKPAGKCNYMIHEYIKNTNDLNLYFDYNSWSQRDSEEFVMWDYANATNQVIFTYAEGPGGAGNDWYDWYDHNDTPPSNGSISHYHCDIHSVTTEPPFNDVENNDYVLTENYQGIDISGEDWYISEMGNDFSGITRTNWDIGAYEYSLSPTLTLTTPNGGETWLQDSTYAITWNSTNLIGDLDIELYKGTTKVSNIGTPTVASGIFNWTLPHDLAFGTDYSIHLSSGLLEDSSNVYFTIGNATTTNSFSVSACNSYTVPSGDETYTSSGVYTDTIPNTAGYDSIMTIDVSIIELNISVTDNSPILVSDAINASYQWLDCNNNYVPINGETNKSFLATSNGNYAVEITNNGCIDTSECFTISGLDIEENSLFNDVSIYPNPNQGNVNINFSELKSPSLNVYNVSGQLIIQEKNISEKVYQLDINEAAGIYFIEIISQGSKKQYKLIITI